MIHQLFQQAYVWYSNMVQGRTINLTRYLFILAAIMTAFLPCVTFGQIAEVLDAGEMSKDPLPNLPYFILLSHHKHLISYMVIYLYA